MTTQSSKAGALKGSVTVPGDKSISHRTLMLGSQAIGTTEIDGLLEGEDVIHTADALRQLGVGIERISSSKWKVHGVGTGGLTQSKDTLYMGNSGTSTRLLMGLISSYPFNSKFDGDASLRKRPMKRATAPLAKIGANFETSEGDRLPLTVIGTDRPTPIEYTLPVASAQVKSALMLAALNIPGITTIIEPIPTRDHTERMMKFMGLELDEKTDSKGVKTIRIKGQPKLKSFKITVPGDPSSAAFLVVAALITEGSDVTIANICMNKTRTGLFDTLIEMGGNIEIFNERDVAGEPVADLRVRSSKLKGIIVPASRAPSMIDEYPVLSVAASVASGETRMDGLEELRVKESDRLQAVSDGLTANGVKNRIEGDSLIVTGGKIAGGGLVKTYMDHRIAMSFLVMGMVSEKPVSVDDVAMIATSFPNFMDLMKQIGARFGHDHRD